MGDPRDDEVSRRYRELPREEPPPALDAAILAAAREARPETRGARLARWAGPLSIAAVLLLGIGISLRMQTGEPGGDTPMPASEYAMPPSEAPAAASAPAPPPAQRLKREEAAADSAPAAGPRSLAAPADPARELERIARLREAGQHAEADRALEAFRRARPDYAIPEALRERVRPRERASGTPK